jgi:hypothetical protein
MSVAEPSAYVDLDAKPWHELGAELGPIRQVLPVGRAATTFVVDTRERRVVVKSIASDRDPQEYLRLMLQLRGVPEPYCPEPLAVYRGSGHCWHAVFAWVDSAHSQGSAAPPIWPAALGLLARMRAHAGTTPWPLERRWLARLADHFEDEPAATALLAHLRATPPEGAPTLAHGDFSVQNLVLGADGSYWLVDWEEVGSAAPGFDAGWMVALARLGVDVGLEPARMVEAFCAADIPPSNLLWFERLATLRLLFRAKTLPLKPHLRELLLPTLREAVAAHGGRMV